MIKNDIQSIFFQSITLILPISNRLLNNSIYERVLLVFTLLILVQLTNAQFYGDQTFNPTDVGYNSFSG